MKIASLLLLVLTWVFFFSLIPPISSVVDVLIHDAGEALPKAAETLAKGVATVFPKTKKPIAGVISHPAYKSGRVGFKLGKKIPNPQDNAVQRPLSILDMVQNDFLTISFTVGFPPQKVAAGTAGLSISSEVTWITAYPNCNINSCTSDQSFGGYYVTDILTLPKQLISVRSTFQVTPLAISPIPAKGRISFSKSPHSVVSNPQVKRFTYFIPHKSSNSAYLNLGNNFVIPQNSGIQSTNQVTISGSQHLYGVSLTEISVGGATNLLQPSDLNGVYFDTNYLATKLAKGAYDKVKFTILQHMSLVGAIPAVSSANYEMCYQISPFWPRLTFSFSGAQMVLGKENYVLTDDVKGVECAAILPVPAGTLSMIGAMAQFDRAMIFDNDNSKIYFDMLPAGLTQ